MTAGASEPLRRLVPVRDSLGRLVRSPVCAALVGAQIIVVLIVALRGYGLLQPFELLVYDGLRVAWAGNTPSARLLLVGGTEADVEDFDWPLRDGDLADLLERIASWHPRVIGVDIYRDRPKPPGHRSAGGGSLPSQGNCLDVQTAGWSKTCDPASRGAARDRARRAGRCGDRPEQRGAPRPALRR